MITFKSTPYPITSYYSTLLFVIVEGDEEGYVGTIDRDENGLHTLVTSYCEDITLTSEDLQTIIDKINELNNVKPSITIDIKRYAQAVVDFHYIEDFWMCIICGAETKHGQAHKTDCIVLDAERILKELENS